MFTVLGSSGFIGTEVLRHLVARGHSCLAPDRDQLAELVDPSAPDLGHVVYCIGLTGDFRQYPFATVEAHVSLLARLLEGARFQSFLYLSSTRVYWGAASGREDQALRVDPARPSDLYNLTKLAGESLCLSLNRPEIRVARLSNVYGKDFRSENFLSSVIRDAVRDRRVQLRSARQSTKDYIAVDEVLGLVEKITLSGDQRLYNLASGRAIPNGVILDCLAALTGCAVAHDEDAPVASIPPISVERITEEFGFAAAKLEDRLGDLVDSYREGLGLAHRD